jgi:flagellar biosynthesis/type III secretory pathway protein FliH
MPQPITIELEKPIASVELQGEPSAHSSQAPVRAGQPNGLKLEQENVTAVCQALQKAVDRVTELHEKLVSGHEEQIAKLSVEIAAKILAQKIEQGDYQIESIIQKALDTAPTRQDVTVHLNCEDLDQLQKAQADASESGFEAVKFVADAKIGRGECIVETPKGTVESLISDHLERVSKALNKAE